MIKGIGTDLVRTSRIANSLERFGERFAEKILASREMTDFKSSKDKVKFLSKRFAAKEAVAKALGTGMGAGVHFKSIEVTHKHPVHQRLCCMELRSGGLTSSE